MTARTQQPADPAGSDACPPQRGARRPGDQAHRFDTALETERDRLRALFPLPAPQRGKRGRSASASSSGLRNGGLALAVIATAAAAIVWMDPAWSTAQYATAVGELRTVALADGTRLTLDTATGVRVRWHLRSRRVELLQGRARFDVAHSTLRPLHVDAGAVQVRVVGTVFDVQRQASGQAHGQVGVAVLQGRVQVHHPSHGAAWLLGPGERLVVKAAGAASAVPETFDPAQPQGATLAWAQGRLVFDRTPLRDALAEVQRYRTAPLRLHDDGRLGRQTVTGVFQSARTDQLLDLLPQVVGARVQHRPDGSVDISR